MPYPSHGGGPLLENMGSVHWGSGHFMETTGPPIDWVEPFRTYHYVYDLWSWYSEELSTLEQQMETPHPWDTVQRLSDHLAILWMMVLRLCHYLSDLNEFNNPTKQGNRIPYVISLMKGFELRDFRQKLADDEGWEKRWFGLMGMWSQSYVLGMELDFNSPWNWERLEALARNYDDTGSPGSAPAGRPTDDDTGNFLP